MLQPLCRRTWAPCGQTPIQYAWDRRDRISTIAALSISPVRRRLGLYYQWYPHNIRTPQVVEFVRDLHCHLPRKIILVWDRWNVHRSAARFFEGHNCPWLKFEWLPAYAPDLDPVEAIWNFTKYTDLANFVPDDICHLQQALATSLRQQEADADRKRSYFRFAELNL
jgi:putative transposase